jgi:hypothetical protein
MFNKSLKLLRHLFNWFTLRGHTQQYLIKLIAKDIGMEADASRIDRAVYKGTDCGAWVQFKDDGILVGTIVEGSDAEYSEFVPYTGDEETVTHFWAAIDRCEDFADEHFDNSPWEEDDEEHDDTSKT